MHYLCPTPKESCFENETTLTLLHIISKPITLCAFFLLMINPKEVCYCLYKTSTLLKACRHSNE